MIHATNRAANRSTQRRWSPARLVLGLARLGVRLVGAGMLLVVVVGLGALGGQSPMQARKLASRLAAERAPTSDELRPLLHDRVTRALNSLSALLLLAIIVLMVFKPGSAHS
jgi:uncharacterized membrane protein